MTDSNSTKDPQAEITFEKYRKRGAYHWENYFGKLLKIDCFLRGRYDMVINLLKKNNVQSDSKVIEIGCGDGALAGLIYQKFKCQLFGTEPSEEGIRFSKEMFVKNNFKAEFLLIGGYSLPFPDNHFDFIVLADVIEHLQRPDEMLKEMRRILRKDGKAIVTTPIRSQEHPEDKMHVNEFFPDELVNLCSPYFTHSTSEYSHPVVWHELYFYGTKRYRSLIRLYCRVSDKLFGKNVFLLNGHTSKWSNFKQQAVVLSK